MKKSLIAPLILGLALLVLLPAGAEQPKNYAFVLVNNAPLYEEAAGRALKYVEGITIGDQVTLIGGPSNYKEGGADREFLKVRAPSGKEGWVRGQYLSSKASLAVVKNEPAVIFSEPREVKLTSRTVSPGTIVGVLDDGSTPDWANIQAWDAAQKTLLRESAYVDRNGLSFETADIQSAILMTVALDSTSAAIRKSMLGLALSKYPNSIFRDRIQALAVPASASAKTVLKSPTDAILPNGTEVIASSALPSETTTSYRYDISQGFDSNPKTAWAEGSPGGGVGEWIKVVFPAARDIDTVEIMGGFFDERWYTQNVRLRSLSIAGYSAGDAEIFSQRYELEDAMRPQQLGIQKNSYKRLVLTVLAVYAEEKKDLPISEISFYSNGVKIQP